MNIVSVSRTIIRLPSIGRSAAIRIAARPTLASATVVRNESVDVVRFFAAAGIVFVHATESAPLVRWGNFFRFAVPFYLFASLYFQSLSLRRNPERTLPRYAALRFRRLYLPFFAWSVIYLLAHDLKRVLSHDSLVSLRPSMLWTGTEYHLWFLPFLLLASLVMAVVQRTFLQQDRSLRWVAIAVAIGSGLAFTQVPMPASWGSTTDSSLISYMQWWRAISAACWAMAFAWFMTLGPVIFAVTPVMGVAGIALVLACSLKQVLNDIQLIPRGLTGLGCMLAALTPWRGPVVSWLARYGRYGYGIYLCHVLILEPMHVLSARLHLPPSIPRDFVIFGFGFAGSLALVQMLGRSSRLKWLNG
ncbi:MAG: acyltransferase [Anaerolineae bacterium]|nr:acyltransferase [Phycisphaerae bacterium]